MKPFLTAVGLLTILFALAYLEQVRPAPDPTFYEQTDDPAARVREFVRGDQDYLDEADLYSPSVSPELRGAAIRHAD